jgi:cytochrome c oxidase cbb3-type subunit I/II
MAEDKFDQKTLPTKIAVMTTLGVPYPVMEATEIKMKALEQGVTIARNLADQGIVVMPDRQIVAVIAYLQKLGHYVVPEIEDRLGKTPLGVPFPKLGSPDGYRAAAAAVIKP